MDNEKIKRIEWFFNFLNVDLEKIAYSDKLKWIAEVLNVIHHGYHDVMEWISEETYLKDQYKTFSTLPKIFLELESNSYEEIFQTFKEGSNLKQLQRHLRKFFKGFIDNLNQQISQKREWTSVKSAGLEYMHSVPLAQFESPVQLTAEFPSIHLMAKTKTEREGEKIKNIFIKAKSELLDEAPIRISFHTPKYEDTLLFYLFQAIDGIKISSIRQCPECHFYFLHISKKKKKFCSNKCAARKASRDKRRRIKEKKPELYEQMKEKAKERAHASYKRKQKAENPGAKVRRRPRKKIE